jgi:ribosomal protein S20
MCGHGLVSAALVSSLAEDVKAGRKNAESAAKEMAKMCDCGVFNPVRAARLMAALAAA